MSVADGHMVRTARREDIPQILELFHKEKWYRTTDDITYLFDTYPEGIFVAESPEGEIISHCAVTPVDDQWGVISFYVTKESWLRRGLGKEVYQACVQAIADRLLTCNAVLNRVDMYALVGYNVATFFLVYYSVSFDYVNNCQIEPTFPFSLLAHIDFSKILDYDKKIVAIKREKILKWCIKNAYQGLVAMHKDGTVIGWGAVVKEHIGYRMMPLYADTQEIATCIANKLLKSIFEKDSKTQVHVIFPDENLEAKKLYLELGFRKKDDCSMRRIYMKSNIPMETKFVYSVINPDHALI